MSLGTNILIVDDDTEVRKTLSSILSEEGYLVENCGKWEAGDQDL